MCDDLKSLDEKWSQRFTRLQAMSLAKSFAEPVEPVKTPAAVVTSLTEKQVHLSRLHMRPIQWHLKNSWWVPESGKGDSKMVAGGKQCASSSTITPTKTCSADIYRRIKKKVGRSLKHTARGTWSLPKSKLHINFLEVKAVFLALKEFQDLCLNNTVLIATDNTTVVAYINKEGGMKSGPMCALLWRILTSCTRRLVTFKARHIPGRLNMIVDKLSRKGQTI